MCPYADAERVILQNIAQPTIDWNAFSGFSSLTQIEIVNSGLTEIHPLQFTGLTNLVSITVTGNALTTLPQNLFPSSPNLKDANFSNNGLSYLPGSVFVDTALTTLDLSNNALTGFESGMFNGLGDLVTLYLQNNNLQSSQVHTRSMDPCVRLATINLKNNPDLVSLPSGIFSPNLLVTLAGMTLVADPPLLCSPCGGCSACRLLPLLSSCCYKLTAPTSSPTTPKPTNPTRQPTFTPTRSPTSTPTLIPTSTPSYAPSVQPSTVGPTLQPTQGPTQIPTTQSPTLSPTTSAPTLSPSTSSPTARAVMVGSSLSTPPPFPWIYVIAGGVGFFCLLTLVASCYRRRRTRKKHQRHAMYMANTAEGSVAPSALSAVSSTAEGFFESSSRSPNGSFDGSECGRTGRFGRDVSTMVEIDGSEVEIGTKLGNGAFGSVHQCLWRGTDYAMKTLLHTNQEAAFEKEVEINRHLSASPHIHVTRMVGVVQSPVGIVMELYPMGNVEEFLRSNLLAEEDYPQVLTILITASAGLMHLHSQGIIHRDVAARNFLIKKDHSAAVCDFGLALPLPEGKAVGQRTSYERETDMLPINITAPETLNQGQYSVASDVYMFGMFMWEVIARQVPHGTRPEFTSNPKDFPGFIARVVKEDLRPMVPLDWPPALRTLILQCWERNPANRPSLHVINSTLRTFRNEALANVTPLPIPRTKAFQVVDAQVYYADSPAPQSPGLSRASSVVYSRANSVAIGPHVPLYGSGELYGNSSSRDNTPRPSFSSVFKR